MKAVAITGVGKVEVVDVPVPEYNEYECLVRVHTCGLCNSTDLKIIHNEISNLKVDFPIILGHENAGEVVEKGSKVKNFQLGDRVINPNGRVGSGTPYNIMWAGMAGYAVIQDLKAMEEDGLPLPISPDLYAGRKIPNEISFEDAAVILTLKETYSALKNFGVKPGMDVLLYGDGPVGLGLASFLRVLGAGFVGCVGHRQDRLERIARIGKADMVINTHHEDVEEKLGDRKFDLVVDAVGKTEIIRQAAWRLKPGGKVGAYGVLKPKDSVLNLLELPNHVDIHILSFPYREHDTHDEVVDMILDGRINPRDFYSHVIPIEDVARGIEMIEKREAYKVVLKI